MLNPFTLTNTARTRKLKKLLEGKRSEGLSIFIDPPWLTVYVLQETKTISKNGTLYSHTKENQCKITNVSGVSQRHQLAH